MNSVYSRFVFATAALLAFPIVANSVETVPKATVTVLSTLHTFHARVPGYGFDVLKKLITRLNPDILAVELTDEGLTTRRDQGVKQEYQYSVFPLLENFKGSVITLEPEEPEYSKLGSQLRTAERELRENAPQKAQTLELYVDQLYGVLLEKWRSPCDVNSSVTDTLFEVKHRYQDSLLGPAYRDSWERWNQHALDRVLAANRINPGKRILILMGAEHGYWLRKHLQSEDAVVLLPNCAFDL